MSMTVNEGVILPDRQISEILSSPFYKNILIFRNRDSVYIPCRPALI